MYYPEKICSTSKIVLIKSKITKILNSEENSNRKVPSQMAKSNDKTHLDNNCHIPDLVQAISNFDISSSPGIVTSIDLMNMFSIIKTITS